MDTTRTLVLTFRDLITERRLPLNGITHVYTSLSGYMRHALFLTNDLGSSFEDAWDTIRSRLRHEMNREGVPVDHKQLIEEFAHQAFVRIVQRTNMDMFTETIEVEDDSEEEDDAYNNQRGPQDLFNVLARAVRRRIMQRFLQEASEYQDRDDGLEPNTINSFEKFNYIPSTGTESTLETTCVICQEDFTEGSACMRIPACQHFFHEECIVPWLQRRQTCPTCRVHCVTNQTAESEEDVDVLESETQSEYEDDDDYFSEFEGSYLY